MNLETTIHKKTMRSWLRLGFDVLCYSNVSDPVVLLGRDGEVSGDDEDSLSGFTFVRVPAQRNPYTVVGVRGETVCSFPTREAAHSYVSRYPGSGLRYKEADR